MKNKKFNVGIKGVITKDNKVLILRNDKGFWEVPGGRIDANESIEEALLRELNEELPNIQDLQIGRILSAGRLHKDIHEDVSLVLIFYKVSAKFDDEPQLSNEHQEYRWVSRNEALSLVYDSCKPAIVAAFDK